MIRTIRGRLILSYVLFALLAVGLVGVLALSLIQRSIVGQETEYLTTNAEAVALQARPLLWPAPQRAGLSELAETASLLGNFRVRVYAADQRLLADSGSPQEIDQFVWVIPPVEFGLGPDGEFAGQVIVQFPSIAGRLPGRWIDLPEGESGFFENFPPQTRFTLVERVQGPWGPRLYIEQATAGEFEETIPRSGRAISLPVRNSDGVVGFVEVSEGPDLGAGALTTALRAFLIAAAGAVLLAGLVGLWVARRLTRPVHELAGAAARMGAGDLSARADPTGSDEIGQLAGQFNQMAAQLEESFQRLAAERDALRRFIADASHELRTPITALKNFNELLQGGAAEDESTRREFLQESQAQIERLAWITENLLDLSRLDAGLIELAPQELAVDELLEAVRAAFSPAAAQKGVRLELSVPEGVGPVSGDRARLESALGNLVDNAIKFSPKGGVVTLGAERAVDSVRLWVEDQGPGVPPEEQVRIFERFYRGSEVEGSGFGLGLPIVRSIAEAHGGNVRVESEAGARFIVEIPQVRHPPIAGVEGTARM